MAKQKFPGKSTLAETANCVHQVEAGGFQFIGCTITGEWNVIEFAYSMLPTELRLLLAKETAPANASIFWSGQMLSAGKKVDVVGYRAHESALQPSISKSLDVERSTIVSLDGKASVLSRETVVARAMSAIGTETIYTLHDKVNPKLDAERWPESGMRTDCSSFVAWCLRMSSKVPHPLYVKVNGGWFETRGVYEDGLQATGFFSEVAQAQPGSLLVYGDSGGKQGHMGIVVEADGSGLSGVKRVVHCSSGNFKKTGKAVQQTNAAVWLANKSTIIVDYEGYV